MSESAFKQPISLLLRQEWKQFGGKRQWAQKPAFTRTHATAAAAGTVQEGLPRADIPWTSHHQSTTGFPASDERVSRLRQDLNPRRPSSYLTDNFSRAHNYLRISITERCNLRCVYCMPENGVPLSPPAHLLTTPEIVHLSRLFVSQGVDKIRLTGGEPTVRKDILDLMKQIGNLRTAGLKELCLTTNGLTLHRKLDAMVEAGLTGVNLSLDTLDPYQFTIMTRRNGHDAVMRSIEQILEMNKVGAKIKLKINCVVMRGINEREVIPFVELGKDKDIEVRFIEYMPFDGNKWSQGKMLAYREMLAMIREKYPDLQKVQDHANDTSKTYQVPGFQGRLGFITSMTHNFCGTCNRLRITSDGNLKVCLFGNSEVSLRDILRESNHGKPIEKAAMEAINKEKGTARNATSEDDGPPAFSSQDSLLLEVIGAAVKRKKARHAGMGKLENMKNRPMILIDDLQSTYSSSASLGQYSQKALLFLRPTGPYIHASENSILQSIPSYIQLRHYRVKASPSVIQLRNTVPTRPRRRELLRPVHGQHTFRKIPCPDPDTWVTPSKTLSGEASVQTTDATCRSPVLGKQASSVKPAVTTNSMGNDRHQSIDCHHLLKRDVLSQGTPPNLSSSVKAPVSQIGSTSSSLDSRQMTAIPYISVTTRAEPGLPRQSPVPAEMERRASRSSPDLERVSSELRSSRLAKASKRSLSRNGSLTPSEVTETDKQIEIESEPRVTKVRHVKRQKDAYHSSPQTSTAARTPRPERGGLKRLSHLTSTGDAHMVDISHKIPTRRSAAATAFVLFSNPHPYATLTEKSLSKGDAVAVARIAGIQAAKKTADLIPLAHPGLGLTGVKVDIGLLVPSSKDDGTGSDFDNGEAGFEFGGAKITAYVSCDGKTGVEMEALTAANMAALTMYDMCKAVDKHMLITGVRVIMKKGGKSGPWGLNGDIPDPSPAPILESVLQRRMAGIVDKPENHPPPEIPNPLPKTEIEDPPIAPGMTDDFFKTAASELDLFVANTTSPIKAAEIAGQRRQHKALTARIKELQKKAQHGYEGSVKGEQQLRDGRVDYDVLQRLLRDRREIARKVLGWRIGGGSEIQEASEMEGGNVSQQVRDGFVEKEKAEGDGKWRWEAGVYGVWDTSVGDTSANGEVDGGKHEGKGK